MGQTHWQTRGKESLWNIPLKFEKLKHMCLLKPIVSFSNYVKAIIHQLPLCYEIRSLFKLIFFRMFWLWTHYLMEKKKLLKVLENPFHNFPLSYFPKDAVTWVLLSPFCHPASPISVSRGRKEGKDDHRTFLYPLLLQSWEEEDALCWYNSLFLPLLRGEKETFLERKKKTDSARGKLQKHEP